jgi:hypothetical protein
LFCFVRTDQAFRYRIVTKVVWESDDGRPEKLSSRDGRRQ